MKRRLSVLVAVVGLLLLPANAWAEELLWHKQVRAGAAAIDSREISLAARHFTRAFQEAEKVSVKSDDRMYKALLLSMIDVIALSRNPPPMTMGKLRSMGSAGIDKMLSQQNKDVETAIRWELHAAQKLFGEKSPQTINAYMDWSAFCSMNGDKVRAGEYMNRGGLIAGELKVEGRDLEVDDMFNLRKAKIHMGASSSKSRFTTVMKKLQQLNGK